jgi:hypothetical protein
MAGPGQVIRTPTNRSTIPRTSQAVGSRNPVSQPTQTAAGSALAGVSGIGIIPMIQRQNRKQVHPGRQRRCRLRHPACSHIVDLSNDLLTVVITERITPFGVLGI